MTDESPPGLFGDASPSGGGYLVLARKYRPRTFADLIGQEAMVRTIANSFALGRIAHATMLTGVRGVGKTTTARLLARALNYKRGEADGPSVELDPPGEHCQAIMASSHPDVFEMDAASRTGIGDIRELLESVRYAPVMARYKVYIIDEVHMLSTAAFNGLLKTLEEPPPHVKFIFATTEIRKVPVTVLSRCQRFDLKRIDSERLAEHLGAICVKEGVNVDADGLALIARAAEGSARDGLSLLDQALVQKPGDTVTAADVRDMLGLADRGRVLDLFEAIAKADAKTALGEARSQYDSGADPSLILRDLLDIGHEAARAQALGADARIVGGADWVTRVRALAQALTPAQLSRLWQMLLKAIEEASKAPDPIAALEMAMVRLCAAQTLPPPEDAARMMRDGANAFSSPASGGSVTSAARDDGGGPRRPLGHSAAQPDSSPAGGGANAQLFATFEDVTRAVAEERDIELELALERLKVVRFSADGLIVFVAAHDQPRDLVRRLKAFLEERTPFEWTIRATDEAPAPVESLAERRKREEARALEELKRQPFVAEALKHFPNAEIAAVRTPVDEVGGAVAPFPQKPPETPPSPRKKESDR
jgi:DNA polymerase-3 subunit gamma/tau